MIKFIGGDAEPTYAVFSDFETAFDNVEPERFIQAVSGEFRMGGEILRIVQS